MSVPKAQHDEPFGRSCGLEYQHGKVTRAIRLG